MTKSIEAIKEEIVQNVMLTEDRFTLERIAAFFPKRKRLSVEDIKPVVFDSILTVDEMAKSQGYTPISYDELPRISEEEWEYSIDEMLAAL